MARTLREEIVAALIEGFGHENVLDVIWDDDETRVQIVGFNSPIVVMRDDVIVPDEFGVIASAIALDVRAILAMDEMNSGE